MHSFFLLLEFSKSFCCYNLFSLKLNEIIGGSWSGSPTAISFLQLNLEIGNILYGSSICEHSSRIIILNWRFFIISKSVAAQVAPTTRLLAKESILDCSVDSLIYFILVLIYCNSSYYSLVMFLSPTEIAISSAICYKSFKASVSDFFF